LGLKYKLVILIFGGARYHIISDADASDPDAHAQCKHQFLTCVLSMVRRDPFKFGIFYAYAEHKHQKPDAKDQGTHQFLTH
jgi:hypothetical protein